MTLVRLSPWREVDTLQRQINRMFNEALMPSEWVETKANVRVPAAELTETKDALLLTLELPGVKAEDVDIEVTEKTVSIRGARKVEEHQTVEGVTRSEFFYGTFERVIPLPARVQNTNVTANYKDGLLRLELPKKDEEKNKVVKLKLSEATDLNLSN